MAGTKMLTAGLFAIMLAFVSFTLIGGDSFNVEHENVGDSFSSFGTLTNVTEDNGTLVLANGETDGEYATQTFDADGNISQLKIDRLIPSGSGQYLDVTVTGYDEGGAQVSQQTYDNPELIDLTAQDGTEFDFVFDFHRDSDTAESPELFGYEVSDLGQPVGFQIAVLVMAVAGIVAVTRQF